MDNLKGALNFDISSYGANENNLYGGRESFSFFNREIKKCMPLVQVPVEITKSNGTPNFNYQWTVVVNKDDGDYLMNTWLVIELPEVRIKNDNAYGESGLIRWTENIMHNLIQHCTLSFNEIVVSQFDNFYLDFFAEFFTDENKYKGYMKSIGNIDQLVKPQKVLKSKKLCLPLPLFFCKDTGNAIPLSALPNTEIKINFSFRSYDNLLILENSKSVDPTPLVPIVGKDIEEIPVIKSAHIYGNFVIVSNEERRKMGIRTKDIIIEKIQTSPRQMVGKEKKTKIDLLFKNSVRTLLFAVRNATFKNVWSNYNHNHDKFVGGIFVKNDNNEIIDTVSIKYGNKDRVKEISAEYFSHINPWYHSKRIPSKSGLYMYSYALNQEYIDPCGSENLSRTCNPTLNVTFKDEILNKKENFELVVLCISNVIIKISEGLVIVPTQ